MVERLIYNSGTYALNERFELLYGLELSQKLLPFEEIKDGELTVCTVHNSNLNPGKFFINHSDRQPIDLYIPESGDIKRFSYPYKSAILTLDDELNRSLLEK